MATLGCNIAANNSLRLSPVPFRPLRSPRSRRRVEVQAAQIPKTSFATLASGLLFSRPAAWAVDITERASEAASQLQPDLPDRLPSPEQLVDKAQILEKAPAVGGGILDLFTDNPVLIAGLAILAAVPLVLQFLGGGSLGVKQLSAASALEGLTSDPSTLLVDIRNREDIKEQGSPDLSAAKKKAIALPFTKVVKGEVEEVADFTDKFSQLRQIQPDSSIIILDSYGQEASKAAKALVQLVGRVYYVQDGAVGSRGWKETGQPWKEPRKSLLNLDGLAEDFKNQPTLTKAAVATGAVGVAAAVLFQEAGTVLELAGLAAASAFALPRLLTSSPSGSSSGTTKRQVKQFVEQSEKEVKQASRQVSEQAEKASTTDVGQGIQQAAGEVQRTVKDVVEKPEEAAEAVKEAVGDASNKFSDQTAEAEEIASKNVDEAKQWIEDWRRENVNT